MPTVGNEALERRNSKCSQQNCYVTSVCSLGRCVAVRQLLASLLELSAACSAASLTWYSCGCQLHQSKGREKEQQAEEEGSLLARAPGLLFSREELAGWQAVAASMQACMEHVGPWSVGDFAFGLCAL